MAELTENQIAYVEKTIKKRGIKDLYIRDDIVDHVCCIIEEEMEKGKNFPEGCKKAVLSFGPHGFRKLQDESAFQVSTARGVIKCMHVVLNVFSLFIALGFISLPVFMGFYLGETEAALLCLHLVFSGGMILSMFDFKKFEYKAFL